MKDLSCRLWARPGLGETRIEGPGVGGGRDSEQP